MKYNPIILAIDLDEIAQAELLVSNIKDNIGMIKLGLEFFCKFGVNGIRQMAEFNVPIFLDLKLHDIPNTVAKALKTLVSLKVRFITIHAAGGFEMMKHAQEIVTGEANKLKVIAPDLLGVTVLTSLDDNDLKDTGIKYDTSVQALNLAKLAYKAGLAGVICSPQEIKIMRENLPKEFLLVTPGIRLEKSNDDQKRTMSPMQAIKEGADYLVIGRPITKALNPNQTALEIYKELTNV